MPISYAQSLQSFCRERDNGFFEEWASFLGEVQRLFYDPTLTENPFVENSAENIRKSYVLPFLENGIQKLFTEQGDSSAWIKGLSGVMTMLFKFMWEIRIRITSMDRLISLKNKIGELNLLDIHEPIQADLQTLIVDILPGCSASLEELRKEVVAQDGILNNLFVKSTESKLLDCLQNIEQYCDSTLDKARELYGSVYALTGKITNAIRELPIEKSWCRNEIFEVARLFDKQARQGWKMAAKPNGKLPQIFALSDKKLSNFRTVASNQALRLSRVGLTDTTHVPVGDSPVTLDHSINATIEQPRQSIDDKQLIAQLFINLYNYATTNMSTWGFRSSRLKKQQAILNFVGINPARNLDSLGEAPQASAAITNQQCATILVLLLSDKVPQSAANDACLAATNMRTKLFHRRFLGIRPCSTERKITEFRAFCGSLLTEESINNPETIQQARALAEQSLRR